LKGAAGAAELIKELQMPVSFFARIRLVSGRHLSGFEAIDYCRKFGIEEKSYVFGSGRTYVETPVTEAFARAWFGGDLAGDAEVSADKLLPGELAINSNGQLDLAPKAISGARVEELYIAGRFAAILSELSYAKERLAAAQGSISHYESGGTSLKEDE
jgi:hypothetical protein